MTISEATLPNAVGLKLVNPPLGPTKTSSGGAGVPVFADAWAHELGGVWDGKPMYDWLFRACPVWVHFHARLVFIVTDRIVLLRVRPTAPSRRPFDPPSPGYFLLSGIRISFSSLPSLVFSSRARRST